jgi:hypothetical protein
LSQLSRESKWHETVAQTTAKRIFDLQELWKEWFLVYISEQLNKNGHRPADASELAAWLAEDRNLAGMVNRMTRLWSPETQWRACRTAASSDPNAS